MAETGISEALNDLADEVVRERMKDMLDEAYVNDTKKKNRFNREVFNKFLVTAASDPNFTAYVARIRKGEFQGYQDIAVGKEFRKWMRNLVEKAGVDPVESVIVENEDFPIGKMDWMYDFFAEVLWLYLQTYRFELPKKEGFEAILELRDVPGGTKVSKSKKPGTSEVIGTFEITKQPHKTLAVKSRCPSYLTSRRKVD